jgi:hypothetical protein
VDTSLRIDLSCREQGNPQAKDDERQKCEARRNGVEARPRSHTRDGQLRKVITILIEGAKDGRTQEKVCPNVELRTLPGAADAAPQPFSAANSP